MAEAVVVSGFVGVAIENLINQILRQIGIAIRYKKELGSLERLVTNIQPIINQIQRYRPALNRRSGIPTSPCYNKASAINIWLRKLDLLLREASELVQQCTIAPRYNVIFRYQSSRKITHLISDIKEHLQLSPLAAWAQIPELLEELRQEIGQSMKESIEAMPSSSISSATTSQSLASTGFFIQEPLIVGQDRAFATLERLVIDSEFSCIGVVGKGGSGKSLLLKRIFNSKNLRNSFSDGLLLWLTVSQCPSYKSLGKELCQQIAVQTNMHVAEYNMNPEGVKICMSQIMQAKRFALFLDDVWGEGPKLLEELGIPLLTDHSTSKVIVSSRNHRALLEMGVNAERTTIKMEDLMEDESWQVFAHHAFPYNNRNPPASIEERTARVVCAKCGGLPLAIKAVARSMAGITDPKEWEFAVVRLPNAGCQDLQEVLYDPLRWSYDALGRYDVNLQLCFLYLSAFLENQIIWTDHLLRLFIGEGLLSRKNVQDDRSHDPFEVGRIYINFLADRCLIEPIMRDVDGSVVYFRVHDILRDLGMQIAEREENFYCRAGRGLTALTENECSGRSRVLLNYNRLRSLPESLRAPEMSSLILAGNANLREIPRKVIKSMVSLKILDLNGTSVRSLPESVGCLKQLVCLALVGAPITELPASFTELVNLEVLLLGGSRITELPSDIHRLRSLRLLGLQHCESLQSLPWSMSLLTSLQSLRVDGCNRLWTKRGQRKSTKMVASINDLRTLTQLKKLYLDNNGEFISEGTIGSMDQIETLQLRFAALTSLPNDFFNMSKIKGLSLKCPSVVKMESRFYNFRNLSSLKLEGCNNLEELPDLHSLLNLKKLEIINCFNLKKFPEKFGQKGTFPLLEIFSIILLKNLEELPSIEEGAMPSLQIFTVMLCEALRRLPESFLNIRKLKKIRIWGCSMVIMNLEKIKETNKTIEVVTKSTEEVINILERWIQVENLKEHYFYGEFWCNEFSLFLQEIGERTGYICTGTLGLCNFYMESL